MKFNRLGAFTLGVVITAASVGAVSFANAAGDATIKACANKTTGAMRYISKGSCKKTETSLSWNQMGPQGLPGTAGTNGATGTTGNKGDTGPAGSSSPTGFTARSVCGSNGTTLCSVGVQGPGGGTIFYVDSNNEIPEFDFLEVAPTIATFASGSTGPWSTSTQKCGTAANLSCDAHPLDDVGSALRYLALGTGRTATAAIVARHEAGGVDKSLYAAGVADTYTTATASDWWLPSRDELNEFCKIVKDTRQAVGGSTRCTGGSRAMSDPDAFWSSSEFDAPFGWNEEGEDRAWMQDFDGGGQNGAIKIFTVYVRPVRGF